MLRETIQIFAFRNSPLYASDNGFLFLPPSWSVSKICSAKRDEINKSHAPKSVCAQVAVDGMISSVMHLHQRFMISSAVEWCLKYLFTYNDCQKLSYLARWWYLADMNVVCHSLPSLNSTVHEAQLRRRSLSSEFELNVVSTIFQLAYHCDGNSLPPLIQLSLLNLLFHLQFPINS